LLFSSVIILMVTFYALSRLGRPSATPSKHKNRLGEG
jgi:hypothetical protein